jgi:DNA integrity scanning protein DisA with diadenylate cyclase activity
MLAKYKDLSEQFKTMFGLAVQLAKVTEADALLVWVESPIDWADLRGRAGEMTLVVASDQQSHLVGAIEYGLDVVLIESTMDAPVNERLSQALLESIAEEILSAGAGVIAVYSAFDIHKVDSVSYIELNEHLGRLTARDLRKLDDRVPLETLKAVVDLAIEIGREGREGKNVGTMFVVGDARRVLSACHPIGFDPVKGYKRAERNLRDARTREAIKEIAVLDGAFVVSADATVEASCQLVETADANVTLSKGLGTRHWAAAAITKRTAAIAVTVSESGGTVRIFQDGEVLLRVEPFRHAMKWKSDRDLLGPTGAVE